MFIGSTRIQLARVDSSNNYARQLVQDKLPLEGTVVVADEQTGGRGQRQNAWVSTPYLNLTCSYILRPVFLAAKDQFLLSAVAALAVADAVCHLIGDDKAIRIKWPNDILVNGKKIAGILIENTLRGARLETSIVGVGLNVNQIEYPEEYNATSVRNVIGGKTKLPAVLDTLSGKLERHYLALRRGDHAELMDLLNSNLFGMNENIRLRLNGNETEVTVSQVLPSGQLELMHTDGSRTQHMHHEIGWMLK